MPAPGPYGPDASAAARLLGCREGATGAEVRAAFRARVKAVRPDLGGVEGDLVVELQGARDVLIAVAPPDRRRRARRDAGTPSSWLPLRRSAWGLAEPAAPSVEVRL